MVVSKKDWNGCDDSAVGVVESDGSRAQNEYDERAGGLTLKYEGVLTVARCDRWCHGFDDWTDGWMAPIDCTDWLFDCRRLRWHLQIGTLLLQEWLRWWRR